MATAVYFVEQMGVTKLWHFSLFLQVYLLSFCLGKYVDGARLHGFMEEV